MMHPGTTPQTISGVRERVKKTAKNEHVGGTCIDFARVLANVRAEIRPEVSYALELAAADTTDRLTEPREAP